MSRRFRRAFTETICSLPYPSRHRNGNKSKKKDRVNESKLRLVERHNIGNHLTYMSDEKAASEREDFVPKDRVNEINGINNYGGASNGSCVDHVDSQLQSSCSAKTFGDHDLLKTQPFKMIVTTGKSNKHVGVCV